MLHSEPPCQIHYAMVRMEAWPMLIARFFFSEVSIRLSY